LLQDAPSSEHRAILLDVVCREIACVLRLPADKAPKKQERLMDLGLDSLIAVELRNQLASSLGLESLPATLVFDYPTPDAIAGYLLDRVQKKTPELVETASPQPPVQEKMLTAEEVAELTEEDVAALLRSRLSR
jgi:acyl carrier protein